MDKSDFNREYFLIREYFSKEVKSFTFLVLTQVLDKSYDIAEDVNLGIVNNVKRIIKKENSLMIDTLAKQEKAVNAVKEEVKAVKEAVKEAVMDAMKEEIKALQKTQEE